MMRVLMKAGKGRLMRTTKNGEVTGNKSGRRRELFSIFIMDIFPI